jgi:p-hydroxybenzoate 3-monooxygenase
MSTPTTSRTTVGIVGAGPAGLMLSHLLHRAGILEADSVRLLVDTGVSDRVLREGHAHDGIELRFGGVGHRIDFKGLVGESAWLYPQTDVFIDLAASRERDGADVRFAVTDTRAEDVLGDRPRIRFTDSSGASQVIECDYLVGADGSRSLCRHEIPEAQRRQFSREYPFAWFGILCEAPHSAPELVYAHSDRGFALNSQRSETLQRMYFQCDPDEDVDAWSDDRIWEELQARVSGPDGFTLKEGPITDRTVLRFRSFVCEPMRHGNMLLAGDAAHTGPPTGAKGLNLALADVKVLAEVLEQAVRTGEKEVLDTYSPRAQSRVWKAQHFSYWMTSMLHTIPGATDFDRRRQVGELAMVTGSEAGARFLAEAYTRWPEGASGRA